MIMYTHSTIELLHGGTATGRYTTVVVRYSYDIIVQSYVSKTNTGTIDIVRAKRVITYERKVY